MLKYLVIQLDDTSVSFCHYNNDSTRPRPIGLEALKKAIFWSMTENLTVQFLYPGHQLPEDYKKVIADIDHADIVPSTCEDKELLDKAEIVVFDTWGGINRFPFRQSQTYVIRTSFADLFTNGEFLDTIITKVSRLNIVITDIPDLTPDTEKRYSRFLENLNDTLVQEYQNSHCVQVNTLTDRMMLDSMNNCGAGTETITLAPDGRFYVCPGFYLDNSTDTGDVENGPTIKNPQLYQLDHAPICRICDAYQCHRCVWLNKKQTLEINTPGKEQCVVSHIERNASRKLLSKIRRIGAFLPDKEIPEVSYLDPFDKITYK